MSHSNGRQEPMVIRSFVDGPFGYDDARMKAAIQACIFDRPSRAPKAPSTAKFAKDVVDLIVGELEIPRSQAERALEEHGDVVSALKALIKPQLSS